MNTKHPLYKEKIKIERELDELYAIKKNQNLIPYPKPIKNGYEMVFDLRDDIKNRDDAWVFYKCIELVGETSWCRDKSFKKKVRKGKYEYIYPGFGYISEKTYEALHVAVKKYFSEIGPYHRNFHPNFKRYKCVAPSFYFIKKIKPNYITHYYEYDSVLESQISERRDVIYGGTEFYGIANWRTSAPRSFCKYFHRSDRKYNKQTIKKNIMYGGEHFDEFEYRYNHKHSATWIWW